MSTARRLPAILALLLAAFLTAAPAHADDAPGSENNVAVAVNTQDGASVFRLAFSVRMVANGVIDEDNRAYALASCTDCQTVALAFQVVLAWGDVDVVVPENQAVAINDQCAECLTYASATQIVLGFDGPVRFTDEGRRRLAEWYRALSRLEDEVADMGPAELLAAVSAAEAELIDILREELVPVPAGSAAAPTTTSTAPGDASTSTSTTAAAEATTSSSTTTTSAPSTTTPSSSTSTTSTTTDTTTSSTSTTTAATTTTVAP